jgi:hypothetical protein
MYLSQRSESSALKFENQLNHHNLHLAYVRKLTLLEFSKHKIQLAGKSCTDLTTWNITLFENVTGARLVKKFSACIKLGKVIAVCSENFTAGPCT